MISTERLCFKPSSNDVCVHQRLEKLHILVAEPLKCFGTPIGVKNDFLLNRNATLALNKASIENCKENSFHINRTEVRFFVINVVFLRGRRES